ncbi:hypothetical protein D3880_19610 [Pseudomonas cavernae]|uniref:DUF5629 domain-containing protein n=1 Tax=Pseudomonas cavernae TaxID=2320867 RepID=A0A385Z7F0_9PSED|nr:DUF5629 family protein [Pseudomonas cavernae]AYC34440.1 hypothetical protein D3880_19610 [Pseudomonas cavernae]
MSQSSSLLDALASTDMLEIDGLYAWHFELHSDTPEQLLSIEVMDGSSRRLWRFTQAEVQAARYEAASDSWHLAKGDASHRLKCLGALVADNADVGEDE